MPQAIPVIYGFVKAAVFGIGFSSATAAAVAGFTVKALGYIALAAAASIVGKMFAPKQVLQERQASIAQLSIGENPPEVIYGDCVTGGTLADAFNYGGQYGTDWEVLVIILADHEIDDLVGYYIGDDYYAFTSSGVQSGFSGALDIEFVNASRTPPPSRFASVSGGRWTSADVMAGRTRVWVAYKANEEVWPAGRPAFRWRIRGRKVRDPRSPSSPRAWSNNAALCRYDYQRGIYAEDRDGEQDQLLIGRGLDADEALEALTISAANICDEDVSLDGGGTEKRYGVNGVIRGDETHESVEEMFASAMAGAIVQREGGVFVEPGVAKSPVFAITDADIVSDAPFEFSDFANETERVNSIIPRYVSPQQNWKDHAAPVRRDLADIAEDGGPLEQTLSLILVTSETQAGRCAEIARRLGRLERRCVVTLGPRFAWIEDGDWGTFTSALHTGGEPMTVRVEAYALDEAWRNTLILREITAAAYGAVTEIDDGAVSDPPTPPPVLTRGPRILTRTVPFPVTSTETTISIAAHDVTLDKYPFNLSLPSDSISSLTPGTSYGVFWNMVNEDYEAYLSPANSQMQNPNYIPLVSIFTENSGGGFPPPPNPPPGTGGDGEIIFT